MKRNTAIFLTLLGAGLAAGGVIGGCAAVTTKDGPAPVSTLGEKIRKGEIDVGKQYGLAPDRRYHKIHSEVLALECGACHVEKFPAGTGIFAVAPAVDISKDSPAPIDRRVCLGCHTGGVASKAYGP